MLQERVPNIYLSVKYTFLLIYIKGEANRRTGDTLTRLLQIDSGAETGLVNLGRHFTDRMLLMIGNFNVRYVREQVSLVSRVRAKQSAFTSGVLITL